MTQISKKNGKTVLAGVVGATLHEVPAHLCLHREIITPETVPTPGSHYHVVVWDGSDSKPKKPTGPSAEEILAANARRAFAEKPAAATPSSTPKYEVRVGVTPYSPGIVVGESTDRVQAEYQASIQAWPFNKNSKAVEKGKSPH